ncbi:MAG: hypothetical protein WBC44_03685 [Planctomycetaceae bacterium]
MWKFDQAVINEIANRRSGSTCAVMNRAVVEADRNGSVGELFDAFVARFSFTGLGGDWVEVSLVEAKAIAGEILWKDLAYGVCIMARREADALAGRFFSLFGPEVHCFTNRYFVPPGADRRTQSLTWNPITDATFDIGVVCFDRDRVGILWVQDED